MKNVDIIKAVSSAKRVGDMETANTLASVLFKRWAAFESSNDREPSIKLWYETAPSGDSYYALIAVEVNTLEAFIPVPHVSSMLVGRMLQALAEGHPGIGIRKRHNNHGRGYIPPNGSAAYLLDGFREDELEEAAWTLAPATSETPEFA